ncbi:MAG: hypothetical protein ACE5HE_09530 [Phycisphaerae bacterium]
MWVVVGRPKGLIAALTAVCVARGALPTVAQTTVQARDAPVRAHNSTPGHLLSIVPGEVSAALMIRDLAGLDAKLRHLGEQLGQPVNPYARAKSWLEVVAGIHDKGPAAVILMPAARESAGQRRIAMLLPTDDRAALLRLLSPQQLDDRSTRITLRGHESYAGSKGAFTVFASSQSTLTSILDSETNLGEKLALHQKRRAAYNDVTLWVDVGARSADLLGPLAPPGLRPLVAARHRAAASTRGIQLSARIEQDGVALELSYKTVGASRAHTIQGVTTTMLRGLPDERFVIAAGTTTGVVAAKSRSVAESIAACLSDAGVLDPTRSRELRSALEHAMSTVENMAASVSVLPEEADGTLGVACVVQTAGKAEEFRSAVESLTRAVKSEAFASEDVNRVLDKLAYHRAAETDRGITVDHLVLDPSTWDSVSQPTTAKLLGSSGLLIRLGVVGENHSVLTIGGGFERFYEAVRVARESRAPLASNPGTMMSALGVARRRWLEAYVSVDGVVDLVGAVYNAGGTRPDWPEMPETNAPVAMAMHSVRASVTQVDVFVPTEALIALKAVVDARAPKVAAPQP